MRQGVVQVEEVQLEVLHRLQAVESVLEDGKCSVILPLDGAADRVEVLHAGRKKQELDVFQPGEGKGVDNLDGIVVDHQHGNVLGAGKGVALDCVNPEDITLIKTCQTTGK